MGTDLGWENLRPGDWFKSSRGCRRPNEFTPLSKDQQLIPGEDNGCRAESRLLPGEFARLQFDTAKTCGRLEPRISPAVNPVKVAVMMNGSGIMSGQRLVGLPDFVEFISIDLQYRRSRAIAGGKEYRVANDQWRGGGYGAVDGGTEGKLEQNFS